MEEDFFVGANLPWVAYGCDFGANLWQPGGGMRSPERQEMLRGVLAALSNADVRVVRWFMLCDGRAGLRFERNNVSLDDCFFPDVDAALEIAQSFNIRVMFTLFDFRWFFPASFYKGVQAGGHARFFNKWILRRRLLNNVVKPILSRYRNHPAVHSWDVFNEPDWVLRRVGTWKLASCTSLRKFRGFLKDAVYIIHRDTCQPATLGLARRGSIELFRDCDLDFHQYHWYDQQGDELWTPLQEQAPVVVGEFPTTGSSLSVAKILHSARQAGAAGAMGWSAKSTVRFSSLPSLLAGISEFRQNIISRNKLNTK